MFVNKPVLNNADVDVDQPSSPTSKTNNIYQFPSNGKGNGNGNGNGNGGNGNGNGSVSNNGHSNGNGAHGAHGAHSTHTFSFLPSTAVITIEHQEQLKPSNRLTFSVCSTTEAHYPDHLRALMSSFRQYYHMPDCSTLLVSIGAIVAHYMQGPPIWVMLIGAPGSGKTAAIESAGNLPDVAFLASITVPGLLSGTSKKDVATGATGGVLAGKKELMLLLKEFSSILSMPKDKRAELIGALREISDGRWSRDIGGDGGRSITWQGKVSMLAGCTPTIDSYTAVIGSMGERFAFYRLPPINPNAQATMVGKRWSEGGINDARIIQAHTAEAVSELFSHIDYKPNSVPVLSNVERSRLVGMALVGVRCRSTVERDPYHHEITLVSEPENPGRLAGILMQLFCALKTMGVPVRDIWNIIGKMALDCMPSIRRMVLNILTTHYKFWLDTETIVSSVEGYSKNTVRRVLEDLTVLNVITHGRSDGQDLWQLSELVVSDFKQAFPREMDE